jgi:hypothetical protein
VSVPDETVSPLECGCTVGLLGRKSGSGSEGSGSTGVESTSTGSAFPFPLSGLAVLDGVTRSPIPNEYSNLALERIECHTKVDNLLFLLWSL